LLALSQAARGGIPFFSGSPPPTPLLIWSIGYVVVVLAASVLAFSRRDL
jgi:ABC-type transport system involved in multi-copper enzyme maturation permease subunit